jgi:coenzyme F420-0:L-glutamate ligase/coenzyme F420-1:gamma-L-glutamate ligase
MKLIGIHTPILHAGDDIGSILRSSQEIEDGDIVIVSSKAIATVENTFIHLEQLSPSDEANEWSTKTGRGAAFCEAVLQEVARLNGKVVGHCPGAMVTEVRPDGLAHGSILTANAGLDESNTAHGTAIGWPRDPVASGAALKQSLQKNVAVIITDSCLRPRRLGVVAFALTACGLDPIRSEKGKADLGTLFNKFIIPAIASGNLSACEPMYEKL